MAFDVYSTSGAGQNKFQPLPIQTARDPVQGVDMADGRGGPYVIDQEWFNTTSKVFWKYIGSGLWIQITGGSSGPAVQFPVPAGTSPVVADVSGNVTLTSTLGTVVITGGTNAINFDLAGSGGPAIEGLIPDAHTAPGTTPVVPTSGNITLEGGVTFATGTQANPIRTNSLAANTMDLQIQLAGSNAGSLTANKFGVAQFDSNQFSVTSGFVQLAGGTTAAIEKINLDTGTSPIVPSSSAITLTGATVAAGTHPVRTDGTGANTGAIEVQISQAIASTDVTKIGLSNFNSSQFSVDANGFVSSTIALTPGFINLGMTLAGGVYSVTSASGAALSASNPGYVSIQSNVAPGTVVKLAITANQTFNDHSNGAPTIDGNLFGFINTDVVNSDVPFFLYAVLDNTDANISFMISRTPGMSVSPVAGNIGKTGSSIADVSFAFFALGNPTVANFASKACIMIGSFRMRMTVAGGDWTVQTFLPQDGIANFQQGIAFTLPTGVLGASASTHWMPNGGTAPVFNSPVYRYFLTPNGVVTNQYGAGTTSSNGAGAVTARLVTPFPNDLVVGDDYVGGGRYEASTGFQIILMCFATLNYMELAYVDGTNSLSGVLTNADLGVGNVVLTLRLQNIYNVVTA